MQWDADKLWDAAEEMSMAAGHPFMNRKDVMVRPRPQEVGILERVVTELRRRVENGDLAWPPA